LQQARHDLPRLVPIYTKYRLRSIPSAASQRSTWSTHSPPNALVAVFVIIFVCRMRVWMIVRRPIGVRMLVGVLLVRMLVFVVIVIVRMTVLRTVAVRMRMRMFVALHDP
jgi:hypothetical protein